MPECASGTRCAVFDRVSGVAGYAERALCGACVEVAERDVRALSADYRELEQLLPRGSGTGEIITGGSMDPATPVDLGIDALQRRIVWTLTTWEPAVREAAGLRPEATRRTRDGWAVATAVAVIAPRVELLAGLPAMACRADGLDAGIVERDGLEAVAALRDCHRRARHRLGLSRLVQRLPGDCSACGAWDLRRDDGSDTVRCGQCAARWTYDDYVRYVGLMVEAAGMTAFRAPSSHADGRTKGGA